MVDNIRTIYVKELDNIDEIFEEDIKLPIFFKRYILFLKRLFCIVTIKENGICILPYKELKSFSKIKIYLLRKIFIKINLPIALSDSLNNIPELKKMINDLENELIEGKILSNYLLPEIIEYICRMIDQKSEQQEVTLLIEKLNTEKAKLILEFARKVKRLQIVTTKIGQFQRLENELKDKFGIACQITSNRRKSLLKSKIIINLDASEELFNQFSINSSAIIIDINNQINIKSKAFCGIHVYDYQIKSNKLDDLEKTFEKKKIYESMTIGANYEQIRKMIEEEKIQITNLIGKNGIIHSSEYKRTSKK